LLVREGVGVSISILEPPTIMFDAENDINQFFNVLRVDPNAFI
jgi:hypothetical protein